MSDDQFQALSKMIDSNTKSIARLTSAMSGLVNIAVNTSRDLSEMRKEFSRVHADIQRIRDLIDADAIEKKLALDPDTA